jgi:hypothetical protein
MVARRSSVINNLYSHPSILPCFQSFYASSAEYFLFSTHYNRGDKGQQIHQEHQKQSLLPHKASNSPLFLGAEVPLVESFELLNGLFPFPSILDAGYPVLDLQLANVLFDVILPSVLGSSLGSFS